MFRLRRACGRAGRHPDRDRGRHTCRLHPRIARSGRRLHASAHCHRGLVAALVSGLLAAGTARTVMRKAAARGAGGGTAWSFDPRPAGMTPASERQRRASARHGGSVAADRLDHRCVRRDRVLQPALVRIFRRFARQFRSEALARFRPSGRSGATYLLMAGGRGAWSALAGGIPAAAGRWQLSLASRAGGSRDRFQMAGSCAGSAAPPTSTARNASRRN